MGEGGHPLVRFHPPFGFFAWARLQREAAAVLSDSGTLTEEAALIGFPAVALREAHERPEGSRRACLRWVGSTRRACSTRWRW